LAAQAGVSQWPVDRVRVIPHRGRKLDEASFRTVASGVLERKQLSFDYRARSTDESTKRTVSPQRITHYRDNWYLDAWDHGRDGVRSFAVDRINHARLLESVPRDVPDSELDEQLAASYGIFSGAPKGWATIVFSAKAMRFHSMPAPGAAVRQAGSDVRAGDLVVQSGQVLTPARIGLAAALGLSRLAVAPRPTIAVLATGDELVEPGMPLGPGQIYNSNRDMLMAQLRALGYAPTAWPTLPDD
uniref:WYL domain-containing protein n=1 Tax=Xanthomonas arboricola TaxID=56448 RepID=UPI001F40E15B